LAATVAATSAAVDPATPRAKLADHPVFSYPPCYVSFPDLDPEAGEAKTGAVYSFIEKDPPSA